MEYICGLHKRYSCAMMVTAFYIIVQAFLLLACEGPSASCLQDRGSIYVMEAMKSISSTTLSQRTTETRLSSLSVMTAPAPRAISEAFSDGLNLAAERTRSWVLWDIFIGSEQESHPSSDRVARK